MRTKFVQFERKLVTTDIFLMVLYVYQIDKQSEHFLAFGFTSSSSALYTAKNLVIIKNLKWLSRVPLAVKQAKQLISQLTESDFKESKTSGYRWSQQCSDYAGITQRWLVVESALRREADLRQLEKAVKKSAAEAKQKFKQLSSQKFACGPDAIDAAEQLSQKFKYHQLTQIEACEICPKKSDQQFYKVQADLEVDAGVIAGEIQKAGRFIRATNVLDNNELSPDKIIETYKQQQCAERGFSFLKDPLFFTDSVFIKSSERIESLALIMGLCLLVYTLAQRDLRSRLKQEEAFLKNQLGQPTNRPTLRWIFQCFQSVHLFTFESVQTISNFSDVCSQN